MILLTICIILNDVCQLPHLVATQDGMHDPTRISLVSVCQHRRRMPEFFAKSMEVSSIKLQGVLFRILLYLVKALCGTCHERLIMSTGEEMPWSQVDSSIVERNKMYTISRVETPRLWCSKRYVGCISRGSCHGAAVCPCGPSYIHDLHHVRVVAALGLSPSTFPPLECCEHMLNNPQPEGNSLVCVVLLQRIECFVSRNCTHQPSLVVHIHARPCTSSQQRRPLR